MHLLINTTPDPAQIHLYFTPPPTQHTLSRMMYNKRTLKCIHLRILWRDFRKNKQSSPSLRADTSNPFTHFISSETRDGESRKEIMKWKVSKQLKLVKFRHQRECVCGVWNTMLDREREIQTSIIVLVLLSVISSSALREANRHCKDYYNSYNNDEAAQNSKCIKATCK